MRNLHSWISLRLSAFSLSPAAGPAATVSTIVDPAPPHSDDLDSMRAGAAGTHPLGTGMGRRTSWYPLRILYPPS